MRFLITYTTSIFMLIFAVTSYASSMQLSRTANCPDLEAPWTKNWESATIPPNSMSLTKVNVIREAKGTYPRYVIECLYSGKLAVQNGKMTKTSGSLVSATDTNPYPGASYTKDSSNKDVYSCSVSSLNACGFGQFLVLEKPTTQELQ